MDRDQKAAGTIDADEVARFSRLSRQWWDVRGPMGPLHRLNPIRLGYIRDTAVAHFRRDAGKLYSLKGLRIVDIGCGGGVLSEPLARLGASVVGIDPADNNIAAAQHHAAQAGVGVEYRCTTAEALADAGETFDVVLAMEVVEHVADFELFIEVSAALVKPGGLLFVATINRTVKSFALAIVGAEYVMNFVPKGTHNWKQFVTPRELAAAMRAAHLHVIDEVGVVLDPLGGRWRESSDLGVNYMIAAERKA